MKIGYEWALSNGIDLEERIRSGRGLTPDEISMSLVAALRKGYGAKKVQRLRVSPEHIRVRLCTMQAFLDWGLRRAEASRGLIGDTVRERSIRLTRDRMTAEFRSVTPVGHARGEVYSLTKSEISELVGLVAEDGLESPWTHPDKKIQSSLQARNRLIVRLLLTFGLRRGDLLKLYTTDAVVSGSSKVLRVRRRPDDPMDSRRSEPNVKTQERDLPLSNALASELDIYVRIARLSIPGARRSPYLFLDVKRGRPLSLRALNDVFNPLRKIFPRLHPHVCRHTCNELILQESDAKGISRSRALKHMRYINGWLGDNSGVYTRRLVREEARALSLDMQHRLFTLEKFDPKNNEK